MAQNRYFEANGLRFSINPDGKSVTLSRVKTYTKKFTVPSTVNNYPVTGIGEYAFYECTGLTSVTIPDSVTSIGEYAFYECTGLTSVTIPDSVTSIGNSAFRGCTGLTSVTIGNSVTSIGDSAFSGCTGLTSVTIPDSVTSIGACAFVGCTGLTSVTIPDSIKEIERGAFSGCSGLTSIQVASGNPIYDSRVNCNAIIETETNTLISGCQSTIIPDSVTSIGNSAFRGCTGLKSVTIPNSVTSIGGHAFVGCTGLANITIPNSVTAIGIGAFAYCSGLTSVTIPDSVTSICKFAFLGCSGLTSVTIPDSVSAIGKYAFYYCTGLTSVTIGNSVTSIGNEAFNHCTGLKSVTIPDSVTAIGDDAFEGTAWYNNQPDGLVYAGLVAYKYKGRMPSGTSIVIKDGAKGIAGGAFEGCTGLTSVTIPDSVTAIGWNAFTGTAWFDNQPDGLVYAGLVAYKYKGRMPSGTSIVLKVGTKSISDYAFKGCTGLTSVSIPDSVTSIGDWAFDGCTGLTSVTIPDSVTAIGNCAFSGSTGLTSVTIGNSVTSIGDWVFYGCTGLTSVTIPDSVTAIGDKVFSGCTGLTSVTIPNSVISIGSSAFEDCPSLKQVILTGFGHNSKVLPEEIQNQIEILRIGSGISEIGNFRCNPKEIWCYAEVPPKCSEGVFTGFDAVLHVPQRAAAAYFTADVWRNFSNIVFDADEKLTLSHSSVNMGLLETFQLSATAEHTQESGVVWSSSDPSIATVSEQGVVRAIQPGTCRIYAKLADNSAVYASCEVKVDNRVIISLESDTITIQMRAMTIRTLEPKFYPREVDVTVTSSDPGVVLPREDGQRVQLLGLKAGECRVTLSAPDARPVTVTVVVTDNDV